jgi:spore coat polysaccharide biosynthesis protein SpsF
MNIVAIIQARMSSTRLPGKVIKPLADRPVIWHVVNRIRRCSSVTKVVVATSIDDSDDCIYEWCKAECILCHRGSLDDVLDRYYQTAVKYNADLVVRITADCPVIDTDIVDDVVKGFSDGDYDLYGLSGEFPDGLDCTVIAFNALKRAWKEAKLVSEREHVGSYVENHPELFKIGGYKKFTGLGHHRWTLDEPRDYEFLKEIFKKLYSQNNFFSSEDILALLLKEPDLMAINGSIIRNEGYLKSKLADRLSNEQS